MKLAKLQKKITLAMYKIYRDVCFQKGWQLNEHKHNPPSWELIAPKKHFCTERCSKTEIDCRYEWFVENNPYRKTAKS